MSLNFNLRSIKAKESATQLFAVLKVNEKQMKFSCGLKVNASLWDKKKQTCIINENMVERERENNFMVNEKINTIKNEYLKFYMYLCNVDDFTTIEVIEMVKSIVNEQRENKDMANKNAIPPIRTIKGTTLLKRAFAYMYPQDTTKENTYKSNLTKLNSFLDFVQTTKKGDSTKLLTQQTLNEFCEYLQQKGISAASINQACKHVARLINDVLCIRTEFAKYHVSNVTYKNIKSERKNEETKKRALTNQEINAILNVELNDTLNEYRDIFNVQLNCGQRVSDIKKLFAHEYTINEENGIKTYIIDTKKEGITAVVVENEVIKNILNKYQNGFSYVVMSSDKFENQYNRAIKKISELAGLTHKEKYYMDVNGKKVQHEERFCEIVTNHFARHTFITNKLREGFTPAELSNMTGHADDKMITKIYAHLTKEDKVNKVAQAIKRVNKEKENTSFISDDESINNAIIANNVRKELKEKKDNEMTLYYSKLQKRIMLIENSITSNYSNIQGKAFEMYFGNFPTIEERLKIYSGASVMDVLASRVKELNENVQRIIRNILLHA